MNSAETRGRFRWYWIAGLAVLPLVIAGLFAAIVTFQSRFRYDDTYFTPQYQALYDAPGVVARNWEKALQTGNPPLLAELTGLRREPRVTYNPNIILTVLLEVDDAGYFHYLYFDIQTYRRSTYHIKEVDSRWVVVPEDAYYYWDSGRWWGVFAPIAIVWWLILIVTSVGMSLSRVGARARDSLFQPTRSNDFSRPGQTRSNDFSRSGRQND